MRLCLLPFKAAKEVKFAIFARVDQIIRYILPDRLLQNSNSLLQKQRTGYFSFLALSVKRYGNTFHSTRFQFIV